MDTKIGSDKNAMLTLTSSGFWAYVPKLMTTAKFYSVNNVTISTHRNFVEHTMPGRKGSVFQDMGRRAIKIVIEGNLNEGNIMTGVWKPQSSKPMLAELHKLCDEGKPLQFVCDMPALFGVSQVIIADLEATEAKGRKYDYDYKLTLREWTEPLSEDPLKEYLASRAKDAWKKAGKKALIVTVASVGTVAGVTTFAVAKSAGGQTTTEQALVVSLRFDRQRLDAGQSAQVTAVVSDSKGVRVEGATVTVTSTKGTDAEQTVASDLKTNSDGLATATFNGSAAGTYTIKAAAKKAKYKEGSGSAVVIVDEVRTP